MKFRNWRGCVFGAVFGFALFVIAVGISNDLPELGGILLVPFVMLVFAPLGALVEWLLHSRPTLTLPTRADFLLMLRGLVVALGICLLLLGLLAIAGRELASP